MRKRQSAAPSANSCCRCTAILHGQPGRCTMCGWPVGVSYPPAEGELAQGAATASDQHLRDDVEPDEDHTGAQLDALSSMIERQTLAPATASSQPPPAPEPSTADVEQATRTVDQGATDRHAGEPAEADTAEEYASVKAPALVMAESGSSTATPAAEQPSVRELDPLTAPLDDLEPGSRAEVSAPSIERPAADDDPTAEPQVADVDPHVASATESDDLAGGPEAAVDEDLEDEGVVSGEAKTGNAKTLTALLALVGVLLLALVGVYTLL